MKTFHILGTPLLVTDDDELAADCLAWARRPACTALEFVNTHIVTMCRHDPAFHDILSVYDHLLPDGMPLIWCLNRAGAGLKDRVYGPTFMRYFLKHASVGHKHYLLGGSAECGAKLREVFSAEKPGIQFVGSFHGKCDPEGRLENEETVLAEIERPAPDFIWVGFGTPKQQAWVKRYKHRLRRGVVLTVGFAFDVNAGMKPDAPQWMQPLGLTWVYRLWSEPRR